MITGVLITNFRGDVLFRRYTRPDEIKGDLGEVFRVGVVLPGEAHQSPIARINNITFCFAKNHNLYLVATTTHNADCLSIFEFLGKFSDILEVYLEGKFDQKHVEARIPLLHELVEDYGYPQLTDIETVDKFVTQGKVTEAMITNARQRKQKKVAGAYLAPEQITESATGMTPWRAPGIVYKRNELWIDVIENVHLLVSPSGQVLRAYVDGKIQLKCQLSGQPQCEFGMNDKLLVEKEKQMGKTYSKEEKKTVAAETTLASLDDMSFHQCVRLPRFEADRTVSFVPPDGSFTLMTYRTSQHVDVPFKIISHVKQNSEDKMDYQVSIVSEFDPSKSGTKVVIKIPTPPNTALCHINVKGIGKAVYKGEESGIIWRIKKFSGKVETSLRASVELLSTTTTSTSGAQGKQIWDRPPITMRFMVHSLAASGLRIRYLRVSEKSGYHPYKWVRYLTQAGEYEKRI